MTLLPLLTLAPTLALVGCSPNTEMFRNPLTPQEAAERAHGTIKEQIFIQIRMASGNGNYSYAEPRWSCETLKEYLPGYALKESRYGSLATGNVHDGCIVSWGKE